MTKYVLKKDTPFYKEGTEFSEDLMHKGVILDDDCHAVANLNELDNPDEWFDMVDDKQLITDYLEWAKGALNETQETDDGEY